MKIIQSESPKRFVQSDFFSFNFIFVVGLTSLLFKKDVGNCDLWVSLHFYN